MLVAGRYQLTDMLGHGGMGEVWLARDEVLRRPVAVKLLVKGGIDPHAAERFELEARTAARLSHPNIVTIFDLGTFEDRLFLVMEPLTGRTMATELADHGPREPQRVAGVGAQVASALDTAHQHGVLHRDVKPANLLLADDDQVKIGDFGIAQFVGEAAGDLTGTGELVGTSLYLAPERIQGGSAVPTSDVYALGCVLYQMLVGRPPLSADSPVAILHQHLTAAPEPPRSIQPEVSESLDELIMSMLAKDPDLRPSAAQVAQTLADAASSGLAPAGEIPAAPVTAVSTVGPLPGSPETPRRARRLPWPRSRTAQAATGSVLVAGIAAAVLALALPAEAPTDHRTGTPATPEATPTPSTGVNRPVANPVGGSAAGTGAPGHQSPSPTGTDAGTVSASPTTASPPATTTHSPQPTPDSPSSPPPSASPTPTTSPTPTPSPSRTSEASRTGAPRTGGASAS